MSLLGSMKAELDSLLREYYRNSDTGDLIKPIWNLVLQIREEEARQIAESQLKDHHE
jgi:hypothetical protein